MREVSKKMPRFLSWEFSWLGKIVNAEEADLCGQNNAHIFDILLKE